MRKNLLEVTGKGLYCGEGKFYIDPWKPVDKAVITHAHSDHARFGSKYYLASDPSKLLLKSRLGDIKLQTIPYGEAINFNGVKVSLHPAGHVLGSSQIRVENRGEVWVVSGDYKIEDDKTCDAFELVKCNTFITESTFGLPIYKWKPQTEIFDEINSWWKSNSERGKVCVIYAYALGKAQRIIAGLENIGPIFTHGAVEKLNACYRESGVELPETKYAGDVKAKNEFKGGIVVSPPSGNNSAWLRKFGSITDAFASGWMMIRGARRRRAVDRGFVLSDHVDWNGINKTIDDTGAENVLVTHGYASPLVRFLQEKGLNAKSISTRFEGEPEDDQ